MQGSALAAGTTAYLCRTWRLNHRGHLLLSVLLIKTLSELIALAQCQKKYILHQSNKGRGIHGDLPTMDIFLLYKFLEKISTTNGDIAMRLAETINETQRVERFGSLPWTLVRTCRSRQPRGLFGVQFGRNVVPVGDVQQARYLADYMVLMCVQGGIGVGDLPHLFHHLDFLILREMLVHGAGVVEVVAAVLGRDFCLGQQLL